MPPLALQSTNVPHSSQDEYQTLVQHTRLLMILPLSILLIYLPFPPSMLCGSHTEYVRTKLFQLCLTLCDPMDRSQAPLSMEFFGQEYWTGLPCPLPGDFPDSEVKPTSLMSPALSRWVLYHWYHLENPYTEYTFPSIPTMFNLCFL